MIWEANIQVSCLKSNGIEPSYSLKGHPYDNSYIKGFHSLLKREWVYQQKFKSIEHAILSMNQYINWFNNERLSYQQIFSKVS
ncbi:integrase core domain-containing protein [Dellaglioa sp. BT-FLS60]